MSDDINLPQGPEFLICENPNRILPFYVTELGCSKCECGRFERNGCDGYLLIFALEGSCTITAGKNTVSLHKNNMLLLNSLSGCRCAPEDPDACFLWMQLDGTGVRSYAGLLGEINCGEIPVMFRGNIIDDINYIALMAQRSDLISMVQISNTLSEILSTLLTQRLSSQLAASKNSSHYDDIHSAVEYIRANYRSDISLKDITAHVNISKYYFIRLFKEQMGMTPYEYMINYRIYRAKLLLRSTDESVNKIASRIGFSSPSNFIRHFKKAEGVSPAGYRRGFSADDAHDRSASVTKIPHTAKTAT